MKNGDIHRHTPRRDRFQTCLYSSGHNTTDYYEAGCHKPGQNETTHRQTGNHTSSKKYKNKYRIESARLRGYDYARIGAYFITICTKNKERHFGEIIDGRMVLNTAGTIVLTCWQDLPNHYPNIILDEFVIMPNHIHGIIGIVSVSDINTVADAVPKTIETGLKPNTVETGLKPVSTRPISKRTNHGLSEFVRALKTFSSRRINEIRRMPGTAFWQTRFHEHIIRNDDELSRIREYISDNPLKWDEDEENPDHNSR